MLETHSLHNYNAELSFEFFPPRTEQSLLNLDQTAQALAALNPAFFSVTFGAGGSTQTLTLETVQRLRALTHIASAPHISCIASTRKNILELLHLYQAQNIKRLVVLRGDLPSGMVEPGEFRYANELVTFIREQTGDYFHIDVAAYPEFHPQAENAKRDLENFKRKVESGANSVITQYFYNPDGYFRFIESCQKMGINIPIVPGIMPITNYKQLARFSDGCGAEIPRWIRKRLAVFDKEKDSLFDFGADVVSELCQHLLQGGAPGLHFYTLNKAEASLAILKKINHNSIKK